MTINSPGKKKKIKLPKCWNGLTTDQQLTAYQIIFSNSPDILEPQEILPHKRLELFLLLSGVDEKFLIDWQKDCHQTEGDIETGDLVFLSELDECLQSTGMFFRKTPTGNQEQGTQNRFEVNYGLTKCPCPELHDIPSNFKHRKKKSVWYAPKFDDDTGDGLSNITLYELANTFTLFERLVTEKKTKQKELLVQQLLAVLYRPAKPETPENIESEYGGDIRQPLVGHEATIKLRQPYWRYIPALAKQLFVFWFASCRRHIIEQYPLVFKPPKDAGDPSGNNFGWGGVLLELAGGLPHLQEVYAQPYQNGLIYLSRLEDQASRREMEEKKRRLKKIR